MAALLDAEAAPLDAETAPQDAEAAAPLDAEAAPLDAVVAPLDAVTAPLFVEILAQRMAETALWDSHLHTWMLVDRMKVKVDEIEMYPNCFFL